jgi:hypothetical protein
MDEIQFSQVVSKHEELLMNGIIEGNLSEILNDSNPKNDKEDLRSNTIKLNEIQT